MTKQQCDQTSYHPSERPLRDAFYCGDRKKELERNEKNRVVPVDRNRIYRKTNNRQKGSSYIRDIPVATGKTSHDISVIDLRTGLVTSTSYL